MKENHFECQDYRCNQLRSSLDKVVKNLEKGETHNSRKNGGWIFDSRNNILFKRNLSLQKIKELGVHLGSGGWALRFKKRWHPNRYRLLNRMPKTLTEAGYDAFFLGPLLGTHGQQVKFVDFDRSIALCMPMTDSYFDSFQREMSAYQELGKFDIIPDFHGTPCPHIYEREFVAGKRLSQRQFFWSKKVDQLVPKITAIYKHKNIFETKKHDYLQNLTQRSRKLNGLDKPLGETLHEYVDNKLPDTISLVASQGDLSLKNIILAGKEIKLIDWERYGQRSWSYDLCNLVYKLVPVWAENPLGRYFYNRKLKKLWKWLRQTEEQLPNKIDTDNLYAFYLLFLWERYVTELEIFRSPSHKRFQNFLVHWEKSLDTVINLK